MRVLYLTPNFSNFFAATYDGMIKSLAPYCDLTLYGPGYKLFNDFGSSLDIQNVINLMYDGEEPDVIICWDIEGSGWAGDFTGLGRVNCLKVFWTVDTHNDAVPHRLEYLKNAGIDLILVTYDKAQESRYTKIFQTLGVPIEFYPFSIDPEMFKPMDIPDKYDVAVIGNMSSSYYHLRNIAHEALKDAGYRYHHPFMKQYVREEFARHINECKICVTCSGSFKGLVQKYYEVTACGTLLMADRCMDLYEQHFVDGYNFVEITADTVYEKVRYYLAKPAEAKAIADQGRADILRYHTHEVRGAELYGLLKKHVN